MAAPGVMNSTYFETPLLPPPPEPVLTPLPPLFSHPLLTDSVLTIIGPIIAYWILSITFEIFDYFDIFANYRLHTPEEVLRRNRVSKKEVVYWVFIQQVLQMGFAFLLSYWEGVEYTGYEVKEVYDWYLSVVKCQRWAVNGLMLLGVNGVGLEQKIGNGIASVVGLVKALEGLVGLKVVGASATDWRMVVASGLYWYIIPFMRLWIALFILDTWQYFLHRLMHTVPSLYRAIHSHHHRLYCPYAFGALYNHPLEGFLMDTIGAGMAFKLSGMGQQGAFIFFTFSTLKTVDDHCGYKLPWDPLQWVFWNNAEYHDIHHQGWGIKTNFSQPFFICWDRWLNTQWTGSPKSTSERYRKGREQVEQMIRNEAASKATTTTTIPSMVKTADPTTTPSTAYEVVTTTLTAGPAAVVMNVEKMEMVINGAAAGKIFNGIPPSTLRTGGGGGEEDSGWDDNSSDGSGVVGESVGGREGENGSSSSSSGGKGKSQRTEEQRELRKRRAAAAR